jgi:hypothetical protein
VCVSDGHVWKSMYEQIYLHASNMQHCAFVIITTQNQEPSGTACTAQARNDEKATQLHTPTDQGGGGARTACPTPHGPTLLAGHGEGVRGGRHEQHRRVAIYAAAGSAASLASTSASRSCSAERPSSTSAAVTCAAAMLACTRLMAGDRCIRADVRLRNEPCEGG